MRLTPAFGAVPRQFVGWRPSIAVGDGGPSGEKHTFMSAASLPAIFRLQLDGALAEPQCASLPIPVEREGGCQQGPAVVALAECTSSASFVLGIEAVELLVETTFGRLVGIDRAAKLLVSHAVSARKSGVPTSGLQ